MNNLKYLIYLFTNYDLMFMTKEEYLESYVTYYTNLLWSEISLTNQLRRAKEDVLYASMNFLLLEPSQIPKRYEGKVASLTAMLLQKKNFVKKHILPNPPHPRDESEIEKKVIVKGYLDYADDYLTEEEKNEFESYLELFNVKQYSYHA